eukprot:Awhi_evm1s1369
MSEKLKIALSGVSFLTIVALVVKQQPLIERKIDIKQTTPSATTTTATTASDNKSRSQNVLRYDFQGEAQKNSNVSTTAAPTSIYERKKRVLQNVYYKSHLNTWEEQDTLENRLNHYHTPGLQMAVIHNYEIVWTHFTGVKKMCIQEDFSSDYRSKLENNDPINNNVNNNNSNIASCVDSNNYNKDDTKKNKSMNPLSEISRDGVFQSAQ